MPTDSTIDPARCPLCGKANRCAMELERATGVPQAPCWCTRASFDEALFDRLPAQARRQACICSDCAGGTRPGER